MLNFNRYVNTVTLEINTYEGIVYIFETCSLTNKWQINTHMEWLVALKG